MRQTLLQFRCHRAATIAEEEQRSDSGEAMQAVSRRYEITDS